MRITPFIVLFALIFLISCTEEPAPSEDELSATEKELITPASPEPGAEQTVAPKQGAQGESPVTESPAEPDSVLAADHRDPEAVARDKYRHPLETLEFFGLEPDMTVVELWPGGGGWYTAVLAPMIGEQGQLIAASYPPESESDYYRESEARYREELAAHPEVYGDVKLVPFAPPEFADLGEPGSADLVLTFRNLHNWHEQGVLRQVFDAAYTVLKPGGVFGVVEHRAAEGVTMEEAAGTGYMPPDFVIQLAQDVGFELAAKSEINANPKDTAQHEAGVWTLPPSFRLCRDMPEGPEKDACKEKYRAIGESDRMTLKFVKPNSG